MYSISSTQLHQQVQQALAEDVGTGDISASLIPEQLQATATIMTRQYATLCGQSWLDAVCHQVSTLIHIIWHYQDGDTVSPNTVLCTLQGPASAILTAERTAMNFLQTLSATATLSRHYAEQVADLNVSILDTRKTIPGYRLAQKYAVRCGGCHNHRIGLYDGILLKENHILAAGSIQYAIENARQHYPDIPIEIEVENLDELNQALTYHADIILLDNFDLSMLKQAVALRKSHTLLEASGNVTLSTVRDIALTGIDRISIGALTKHIEAIDLSLRFIPN